MLKIKEIVDLFKKGAEHQPPPTYQEELNRQCKVLAGAVFLMGLFSWLPYIELDINLYPRVPLVLYLRVGLTIVSLTALILYFVPFFRARSYHLVLFVVIYLQVSTALILGLVAADPVYMGGFSIIVLMLPILPLQKKHSFAILAASCIIFLVVGRSQMVFRSWAQLYGGYNVIAALVVSILAILLLDNIRRRNYENYCSVHQYNEKLQKTFEELRTINEELEKASVELSEKNEELREANEIKSELLGIVAHDLKNPLQVIIGYTGLLQEAVKEFPAAHRTLHMINKSSDKMLNLVTELLETATIDSGKLKMNITAVDIGELAKKVVKGISHLAEKKKQDIALSISQGWVVRGDKMLLQQVMDNLISNAVKFSPFGKTIWVTIGCKPGRDNSRNLGAGEGSIVIFEVRDEGPGLTCDDKSKLFGKFQRLSAKPTGGETSTGLGLSIIKDLVELHNGEIHVESEPGKGSTFSVHLPAVKVE